MTKLMELQSWQTNHARVFWLTRAQLSLVKKSGCSSAGEAARRGPYVSPSDRGLDGERSLGPVEITAQGTGLHTGLVTT